MSNEAVRVEGVPSQPLHAVFKTLLCKGFLCNRSSSPSVWAFQRQYALVLRTGALAPYGKASLTVMLGIICAVRSGPNLLYSS